MIKFFDYVKKTATKVVDTCKRIAGRKLRDPFGPNTYDGPKEIEFNRDNHDSDDTNCKK